MAEAVAKASEEPSAFDYLYPLGRSVKEKIETIATKVYGADGVEYSPKAESQIADFEKAGFGFPICMANTHLSISHDPNLKGASSGFTVPVREVRASVGAEFIYPLLGEMRTMPGLRATRLHEGRHRRRRQRRGALLAICLRSTLQETTLAAY